MKTFVGTLALIFAFSFNVGCESEPPEATSIETPNHRPSVVQDVTPDPKAEPNLEPAKILQAAHVSSSLKSQPNDVKTDAFTPTYRLLSWNVESDGADSKVIAEQLTALNTDDHYDIFALTEVLPQDLKVYRMALGKHYKYAYSKSGNSDRLEIIYNEDKFELVRFLELKEINILGRYRAPLVVHLRDRETKIEFLVMVNHLARGKAEIRQQQATMLVEWARDQTLPVFALGDYNFDYVFSTRKGNEGFVNMMRDNVWKWIEPETLIDTNWYDNPREPDGVDDYPGSMLDFAFVAGPAKEWKATCKIIVRDGDFPDDKTTSDHRPYELLIAK